MRPSASESTNNPTPRSAAQSILNPQPSIFKSGEYHDLTIRSGDRSWKVHRAIICPQSKYFTKACSGGFKEAETREIVLEGDEPVLVDMMLHYLYTGLYTEVRRPLRFKRYLGLWG